MKYCFIFYFIKDIEAKLRSLRLAEMYNSTQAQPQVPPINSPWSKVKKKPRPNGDSNVDEEAGFNPTELTSSDGPDLYLDDPGVNLSPAVTQQQQQLHHQVHQHQPITTTPLRRDRSLSPAATNPPISSVLANVSRSEQMPRSAPASPQKMRPNNPSCTSSNTATYQTHYGNGYGHHPHPQIRRFVSNLISHILTHFFNIFYFNFFLLLQREQWWLHSKCRFYYALVIPQQAIPYSQLRAVHSSFLRNQRNVLGPPSAPSSPAPTTPQWDGLQSVIKCHSFHRC